MNAREQGERRSESLNYYSPCWYTLSGAARVAQREGRWYRAEVRISGAFCVINDSHSMTLDDAIELALSADLYK